METGFELNGNRITVAQRGEMSDSKQRKLEQKVWIKRIRKV